MEKREFVRTDFLVLGADIKPLECLKILRCLKPPRVIIHHRPHFNENQTGAFHLFSFQSIKALLEITAKGNENLAEALYLDERQPMPVIEADEQADSITGKVIILKEGRVVGYLDSTDRDQHADETSKAVRGGAVLREVELANGLGPEDHVSGLIKAEFPDEVTIGQEASLLVSWDIENSGIPGIDVILPEDETIDLVVQPKQGFQVIGQSEGRLRASSSGNDFPLQFKLKAVEKGRGIIRVLAFNNGLPLGMLRLRPIVLAPHQSTSATAEPSLHRKPLSRVSVHYPDLTMLVEENVVEGKLQYYIRLTAPDKILNLNYNKFGPLTVRIDPVQYFLDFFKDIEQLEVQTAEQKARAQQRLAAKGASMFKQLFPPPLQLKLWEVRNRIKSIIIQSEEPWIPWELCKLYGEDNGLIQEGPFLCEKYEITRWVPELGFKEPLSLKKIALVVPHDSLLAFAPVEKNYILTLKAEHRKVDEIPANYLDVQKAFSSGQYSAFHFTGHGAANSQNPDHSTIFLNDGQTLTPEDISGVVTNLGLERPIIFLNACQIGRRAMALTGIGGWVQRFLEAGAGAFLGAYWSISDRSAFEFSEALYDKLIAGDTIGKAVQQARIKIKGNGDPTWLAYTVFADPLATVN